jgi:hypothetical protein
MTVTSASSHSSAYAYLQSLLHTAGNPAPASSDPLTALMNSFYPNGPTGDAAPPPPLANGSTMSPDSMAVLLDTQEQGSRTAHAQQIFAKIDANGDGRISQSEFENVFGTGVEISKADELFGALDNDRDGSVSNGEFVAAVQDAQSHHRHRRAHGPNDGNPLQDLIAGKGVDGATTQTSTAADGSTTTTIKHADGSSVSMTTPGASISGSQPAASSSGNAAAINAVEQLLKNQAQLVSRLAAPASSVLATV